MRNLAITAISIASLWTSSVFAAPMYIYNASSTNFASPNKQAVVSITATEHSCAVTTPGHYQCNYEKSVQANDTNSSLNISSQSQLNGFNIPASNYLTNIHVTYYIKNSPTPHSALLNSCTRGSTSINIGNNGRISCQG